MIKYITDKIEARKEVDRFPSIIEVDSETTGLHFKLDKLLLIQIGYTVGKKKTQCVFDVVSIGSGPLSKLLKPVFGTDKYLKIIQNALFDIVFFREHLGIETRRIYDTKLAESVLTCGTGLSTSLGDTLSRYGIVDLDKSVVSDFIGFAGGKMTDRMIKYAAEDVMYLTDLMNRQLEMATADDKKIIDLENRTVEITADMRYHGIAFDEKKWLQIAKDNEVKYKQRLESMPKVVSNWGSPQQVKKYFSSKGIQIDSFSDLDYMALHTNDEEFKSFIQLRGMYQDVKLYGQNWMTIELTNRAPIQTAPTVINGRVHGNFNQILATGRYSSTQPNLQQIRATGPHRSCFKADKGEVFVIADYSGQEIATAAVASEEFRWINTITGGSSVHDLMAEKLFGPAYTNEQRLLTKRINFAILYGSGASTVSKNLLITPKEAKELIYKWKSSVPRLRNWLTKQVRNAEEFKVSKSLYGRTRYLHNIYRTYTIAQNNPIQSTGADMLKLAMCEIDDYFRSVGWGRITLCIHDEIIASVPKEHAKKFVKVMQKCMEDAAKTVLGIDIIKAEPYIATVWSKPKK